MIRNLPVDLAKEVAAYYGKDASVCLQAFISSGNRAKLADYLYYCLLAAGVGRDEAWEETNRIVGRA